LYAENEALSSVLTRLKPLKINYSEVSNLYCKKEGNKVAYDNTAAATQLMLKSIKVAYLTKVGSRYLA
jgi:hypothetical protein